MRKKLIGFIYLNLGILLVAINIHFFLAPNQFAAGGLGGLAIVLHYYIPFVSIGLLMAVFNIFLFFAGFAFVGFQFGVKTIYSSFALSGMVWILDKLFPLSGPLSDDKLIQLIIGLLIAALGLVIVFNQNASTGGMDLIGLILNKYFSIDIGKAVLLADLLIAILSVLAFGFEKGLYALFGIIFRGLVVDYLFEQFSIVKEVVIISNQCDLITGFIVKQLRQSATVHEAKGAYSNDKKEVITIVVKRQEYNQLKRFVHSVDKEAFVIVHKMSEVLGNGFR
ncbi:YitT family protein [Neobacillus sp. LXY-4]|uniref:YitT family protein n=1 Tax=Neobacillus sp. LXY-4 TaxID=3379826 RepID=UPI003EE0AB40